MWRRAREPADRPWGATTNGTQLQQFTCNAAVSQQFLNLPTGQWEAIGTAGPSAQCLDIPWESTAPGVRAQMSNCKSAANTSIGNQVFTLQ